MTDPIRRIVVRVLRAFELDHEHVAAVIGRVTDRDICAVRHVSIWVARKRLAWSYPRLGEAFGHRDHSTIMSSYKLVDACTRAPSGWLERRMGIVAGEVLLALPGPNYSAPGVLARTGAREIDFEATEMAVLEVAS